MTAAGSSGAAKENEKGACMAAETGDCVFWSRFHSRVGFSCIIEIFTSLQISAYLELGLHAVLYSAHPREKSEQSRREIFVVFLPLYF